MTVLDKRPQAGLFLTPSQLVRELHLVSACVHELKLGPCSVSAVSSYLERGAWRRPRLSGWRFISVRLFANCLKNLM